MLERDGLIGRPEAPVDPTAFAIAPLFPRRHFLLQGQPVGPLPVRAVVAQDARLDLRYI
jgi:hypothetical protein